MPSGRLAFVGLAKETTPGTPVAATNYHRFRGGEAVRTEIEEVTPPNILGVFDEGPTYQGLKTHGGDIPFDAHPNILGFYLLSALGPVTTVGQQDSTAIQIDVVAAARTYTRLSGSFITNGFTAGMTVTASGFTNGGNNGNKIIESVTALVITMTVSTGLVNETGTGDERLLGGRWQHTFAPRQTDFADSCSLQPMTFEIGRDLTQSFQYAMAVINRLRLQVGIDEKVMAATGSILSQTMARITATVPTVEATQAFRWNQIAVTLPDPTAFGTMRSLTQTIENNQEGIPYLNGSQEVLHIRSGNNSRRITVEGIMRGSTAEFTEFVNGTERFLKLVLTGAVLGTGNYSLTLEYPRFRYMAKDLGVAGPGEIFVGFRGLAKYDGSVANTPMRAILMNGQASY